MTVLFVGNVDEGLAVAAKNFDADAVLITAENIDLLPTFGTAYISIGDHPLDKFLLCLDQAAELHYIESNQWEFSDTKSTTERWLFYYSHRKPVHNLPKASKNEFLNLSDNRKTDNSQIWVVGDDIAAGIGIEKEERFGELLSDKLTFPISYLVDQSVSIEWCSDQILRSDIKNTDKVVWMLPSVKNLTYYDLQIQRAVALNYRSNHRLDVTQTDEEDIQNTNLIHMALSAIERVINSSRSIGYSLIISSPPVNDVNLETPLIDYLVCQKEFVHCYLEKKEYTDLNFGGNGNHPGPLQHQQYAELFLPYLK